MSARKLFAILISVGLLGTQLMAIPPAGPFSSGYYWPFMNYPMYSTPHYRGEVFAQHKIVGVPCVPGRPARDILHTDLHIRRFLYYYTLWRIAGPRSADPELRAGYSDKQSQRARDTISALMQSQLSEPYCHAQLWEQAVVLGEPLPDDQPIPWKLLLEWDLAPHAAATDSVTAG